MRRLGLALVLAACASSSGSVRSSGGGAGAGWREYTSRHFVLMTDAPADRAPKFIAELERLWALDVAAMLGEQVETAGRIHVLVPDDRSRFTAMLGRGVDGAYSVGPYEQPLVVLSDDAFERSAEDAAHELAHAISMYLFPEQPRWFSEGLAGFVETLGAPADEARSDAGTRPATGAVGAGVVGRVPRRFQGPLVGAGLVRGADLLAWNGHRGEGWRYEFWSWILYDWLWNERSRQFSAYQKRLAEGAGADDAWLASFPEFDPHSVSSMRQLDVELSRYAGSGRFVTYTVSANPDATFVESAISPAEARMWLLAARSLPLNQAERDSVIRSEVEEALREDPVHPYARIRAAKGQLTVETARAIVKDASRDFRSWLALGHAASDPAEKEMALRKAAELGPDVAAAQNGIAWFLVTADRPKEALPFANRAVDLAPWSASAIDTLAETAAGMGKCREALQLDLRAVRMARTVELRETFKGHVLDIEKRCATATTSR